MLCGMASGFTIGYYLCDDDEEVQPTVLSDDYNDNVIHELVDSLMQEPNVLNCFDIDEDLEFID